MASNPYYWTVADNTIHAMEFPDGGGVIYSSVRQYSITYDGTIIVGQVYDAIGNYSPAMWVNGALTQLPIPMGVTGYVTAEVVSSDGTVIAGQSTDGYLIVWTNNGATAAILPQIPNSATVGATVNCISNDGTAIVGTNISTITNDRVGVYWDSAVSGDYLHPIALPNARSNSSVFIADMQAHDVSYIFGWTFSTDFNEDKLPLYWNPEGAETEHPLTHGSWNGGTVMSCSNGNSAAVFIPDGGVSGPFPTSNDRYYWTAVDVASGGYYGTLHQYQLLDGFSNLVIYAQPKDTGQTAVGSVYNNDGTDNVGCVWYNTVPQQLEVPDSLSVPMYATCVAGLAYPIGGYAYTLDLTYRRAGFWNISGQWTTLQVLNENDDTFITGISRDGSVIYGFHSPGSDNTLKLVSLYPMHADGSKYGLESTANADFPSSFSQFSVSLWCCRDVTIRAPRGVDSPYYLNMELTPTSAVVQFYTAAGTALFSGTFRNPGRATAEYHVMFSIDTEAQTYTMWVASGAAAVQWTSSNVTWGSTGEIGG